ncbi:MAG: ribonuclease Z [Candidatus Omnitrophica bacterium ADurb.Bin205]|nr:MAG: ribonuclease Z [Candidatus Omnitrophica bacterium ADurb.Bin205]
MVKVASKGKDFIKFLGTAGARFVMIDQLRASGGIWISYQGSNVLIDPGPGSIVRCAASRPRLNPANLNAIILTHKHLDHANDINVMIEGMTEGGFKRRGIVFCPGDCLSQDSIILKYVRNFPEGIKILRPMGRHKVGGFSFQSSMLHLHTAETYGLKFRLNNISYAFLADTRYFDKLEDFYKSDILTISVVFSDPRPGIDHLCLADAEKIIKAIRPKRAILTHFGVSMLKANPNLLAKGLSRKTGIRVEAAYDGMVINV